MNLHVTLTQTLEEKAAKEARDNWRMDFYEEAGVIHSPPTVNSQGCAPGTPQGPTERLTAMELQEADVRIKAIQAWCEHALAGECTTSIALTAIEALAAAGLSRS